MSHPLWPSLLRWLHAHRMDTTPHALLVQPKQHPCHAGYGLFATATIPPNTPLFTVPASALISIRTLAPHYPKTIPNLSAVQLISLHLSLHRPLASDVSNDPLFGPYISIMPRDFDDHPFTWFLKQRTSQSSLDNIQERILQILPAYILRDLSKMADRFYLDRNRVLLYLVGTPSIHDFFPVFAPEAGAQDNFLWAWLCVNTRCIYHRFRPSRSDPDNLILCPVLDFANHTPIPPFTAPLSSQAEIWDAAPVSRLGDSFTLMSPATLTVSKDSELHLRYGAHPNRVLYVEYGFVNSFTFEDILNGTKHGEVDVQAEMERLIADKLELGDWLREKLEEEGYWGDWTMQSSPYPAHPSYRLITALRLCYMFDPSMTTIPPDAEQLVEEWRKTTLGLREDISPENEYSWRAALLGICEALSSDARQAIAKLSSGDFRPAESVSSVDALKNNAHILWEEQLHVAIAVAKCIENGVVF
ncbi:hypothetical protein BDQ17DRAFT_1240083 [Cyathus striatus]|nr:hypothetical protein BDQ17DRAFT_1240083 [Cyathus striatus]